MEQKKFEFEKAMEEIKQIVGHIEQGDLSLEDSIKQYERALGLIKQCEALLKNAHQKIEELSSDNSDKINNHGKQNSENDLEL